MEKDPLHEKFDSLPDHLKEEVKDFVDFLISQKKSSKEKAATKARKFGSGKGMFKIAKDFDAPLDDFKEYMA